MLTIAVTANQTATWAIVTGVDAHGDAVEVAGSGVLARCFQHETDHLDGCLYTDRLSGQYASAAREAIVALGWTVPGNSWLPDPPEEGQAEIGRDAPLRRGDRRGPFSQGPVRIPAGIAFEPARH